MTTMSSCEALLKLDERIHNLQSELNRIRTARWKDDKIFHDDREAMRCGIMRLRSKIDAALDKGVDFQVFKDALDEVNKDAGEPYNLMHFSHQCLLLSTIHQMEARHNMVKVVGQQSKNMVTFIEAFKGHYEQKALSLKHQVAGKKRELDQCVVDETLAQKVVAQRLVIRKLRSIVHRPKLSHAQSPSSRTIVSFHLEDEDEDKMMNTSQSSGSSRSVESPRDARLIMPRTLSMKAEEFCAPDFAVDMCEVPL